MRWSKQRLDIHVHVHTSPTPELVDLLDGLESRIMSTLEDAVADLKAAVAAETEQVATDLAAAAQQLSDAVTAAAASNTLNAELQAQLDAGVQAVRDLVPSVQNIDPSTTPPGVQNDAVPAEETPAPNPEPTPEPAPE